MAFSGLHIPASGTSPPVHIFQLCRTQNSMVLSTTRGKCGISTAYYGMAKLSQHHRSMVQTDFSYCPVHSCFAKSQPSPGSPCPRRWGQAMPLEYSWGSLELLPLDTLLVQVVVLLMHISSSSEQEVVCEKLLGRRAAAEQRQTMPGSTLKTHLNGRGRCLLPNSVPPSAVPAL